MPIDFHTHTFPEKIAERALNKLSESSMIPYHTNGTGTGLIKSMAEAGIDISVVLPVATAAKQSISINESVFKINEEFYANGGNTGILSFGAIHPDNENYKEILFSLKENGVKGIKLHPVFTGVDINDIRTKRIIYAASELGLIVVTHAGFDISYHENYESDILKIHDMLHDVKPDKAVLAHMGAWAEWERVPENIAGFGIYVDTAFSFVDVPTNTTWKEEEKTIIKDTADKIKETVGINHILFGSDSPWAGQKETLSALRNYFSEEEYVRVTDTNARELLHIK